MKIRLMYIGTLPCEQTGGGPVQMYRHFIESEDFVFDSIIEPCMWSMEYLKTPFRSVNEFLIKLSKTRLYPDIFALNVLMAEHRISSSLLEELLAFRPQAIVTIAFGSHAFVASRVARQLKLPLITFFHDWWPDLAPCRGLSKKVVDHRFRLLYQESDLALCVSESMRQELGSHPNSVVLYPIPSFQTPELSPLQVKHQDKALRLVYLGTMAGDYGQILQSLLRYLNEYPQDWLDLKLYGAVDDWSQDLLSLAWETGVYGGRPKHGSDAQAVLMEADAYLVVASFSKAFQRRTRTSFPSKLLEYAAYGKPIVTWGPEYSSAIRFLQDQQISTVVTVPDSAELIKCLFQLHKDINKQIRLGKALKDLSETLFSPSLIHSQLIKFIGSAVID